MKDSKGFMWFGTDNGLARYDGYTFKTFQILIDSVSTSNSRVVNKIFEDTDGNLWIGTAEHGLQLFDRIKESFTCFLNNPDDQNSLSHNTVNIIYQDRHNVLWVGTNDGLNKFDTRTQNFNAYKQKLKKTDSLKNQISTLYEDSHGTFWIGTWDGLYFFDREKEVFEKFDRLTNIPHINYRKITCIIEDKNGMIWIGTYWGIYKYNIITKETINFLTGDLETTVPRKTDARSHSKSIYIKSLNLFIESIVETKLNNDNQLWIATQWGLSKLDINQEKFETFHQSRNNPKSISTDYLKSIYLDDAGLLWIGTFTSGVEVLNTQLSPFHEVLTKVPGEPYNFPPISFLPDNDETLWVGALDGGLFKYDKKFNFIDNYKEWKLGKNTLDERQHNRINCIYEDSDQNLWLGYYMWGLVIFKKTQKSFKKIELNNSENVLVPNFINNILCDQFGILWIGTNSGLYIKKKDEKLFSPANNIKHDLLCMADIIRIFEDKKSNLWISTRNSGLFCLKPDQRASMKFIRYLNNQKDQKGFSGSYISSIYEDRNGIVWFGSDKGLEWFNYAKEEFKPDTNFNTDYSGYIIKVYGDNQNNLWIFHSMKGLIRYQPYSENANRVKVFDISDGLPFDKFNTYFLCNNSFYQSKDGRIFMGSGIGTGNGFLWFYPDSIKDNLQVPKVILTDFKVGNKEFILDSNINFTRHITLKYSENFFSFEFAALDFLIPEKNQYAYYLEGFEDDWIYSGNRRLANYTGVPPGEYTFRVKGSNNDGYWNEEGTSIRISILPPFWRTWWAYAIYLLVFVAIIYSIIHFYLRRQRLLSNLALEQMESEKLKELDTLKTKFFTNISHEFRTPLTLILGPIQQLITKINDESDKQVLSMVLQSTHRLKDLVSQLLSLSKLESGKMKLQCIKTDIIAFVRSYVQSFESLAKVENIKLVFTAEEKELLAFIDMEKISQVLNNLLSNAFKFTNKGGQIEVSIKSIKEGKGVNISISDNGQGIAPDKLEHIFNRFYQVDDTISREQEGTGIGLAIVKEMVTLHKGKIEVESTVGKGTTFTIYLPLESAVLKPDEIKTEKNPGSDIVHAKHILQKTDKRETIDAVPAEENENESKPILLIVEDNPDMRTFIRGFFNEDFKILEAGDGHNGLKIAADIIPDLIISDVMMPKMDGYKFCQKIKTDERTSHIPVILLTARASKESRMEGLETGADDFITKPFDGEELQVRVKNLIDQRKKLSDFYRKDFEIVQENKKEKILSMDEKFLQKAKSVVEKNLSSSEYGVEEFATDMALSRFQLHRKLSALINQPTTEFIRTIRLNYAIELLKNKTGTISEVAYDAGFNNPTYFSISFKKHFGISPKEYINQMNQKENI